jgi:hypothetical protein
MLMRAILVLAAFLPQESYLPLKEGTHWTYVVEDMGAEATVPAREVVAEVGGAAQDADPQWTPVTNYLGYRACWMRATSDGIDLKVESKPEAPVLTILKSSAKTGDTWTGTLGKEQVTFTLRGEETLEQGDKRLQALHVEFSAELEKHRGHAATHGSVWFAAGMGIVRAELTTDLDCHTALTKVYQLKP